jgi:hypothetical protein
MEQYPKPVQIAGRSAEERGRSRREAIKIGIGTLAAMAMTVIPSGGGFIRAVSGKGSGAEKQVCSSSNTCSSSPPNTCSGTGGANSCNSGNTCAGTNSHVCTGSATNVCASANTCSDDHANTCSSGSSNICEVNTCEGQGGANACSGGGEFMIPNGCTGSNTCHCAGASNSCRPEEKNACVPSFGNSPISCNPAENDCDRR